MGQSAHLSPSQPQAGDLDVSEAAQDIRQHWQTLSPYLDEALGLAEEERAAWLERQDPNVAALLRTLLNEHRLLAQEGFLEKASLPMPIPVPLPGMQVGSY